LRVRGSHGKRNQVKRVRDNRTALMFTQPK
jgi:hypothetical protein